MEVSSQRPTAASLDHLNVSLLSQCCKHVVWLFATQHKLAERGVNVYAGRVLGVLNDQANSVSYNNPPQIRQDALCVNSVFFI